MNDKKPDSGYIKVVVGFGIMSIVAGAYGLSTGDIGWSLIIIGCTTLVLVIVGKA